MPTSSTDFKFPPLKLKKTKVNSLNFDRICFQFSIGKNNECTLIGYKMNEERKCNMRTGLIVLKKYSDPVAQTVIIRKNVLFVQLELTVQQINTALGVPGPDLRFYPKKKSVGNYSYVVYYLPAPTSGGLLLTSPCPPATPPGG